MRRTLKETMRRSDIQSDPFIANSWQNMVIQPWPPHVPLLRSRPSPAGRPTPGGSSSRPAQWSRRWKRPDPVLPANDDVFESGLW